MLATLKAGWLEAVGIKLRVVSCYTTKENEKVETEMSALLFLVVGALEISGGFDRDRWAGKFHFGARDAFDRIEA